MTFTGNAESIDATTARTHALAAETLGEQIRALYSDQPATPMRGAMIAELHHRQGEAFKLAEVFASLAVACEVAEIRALMISGAVTL